MTKASSQNKASPCTVGYITIGSFKEICKLDIWVIKGHVQGMDLHSFPFYHLSATLQAKETAHMKQGKQTGSITVLCRNFGGESA